MYKKVRSYLQTTVNMVNRRRPHLSNLIANVEGSRSGVSTWKKIIAKSRGDGGGLSAVKIFWPTSRGVSKFFCQVSSPLINVFLSRFGNASSIAYTHRSSVASRWSTRIFTRSCPLCPRCFLSGYALRPAIESILQQHHGWEVVPCRKRM